MFLKKDRKNKKKAKKKETKNKIKRVKKERKEPNERQKTKSVERKWDQFCFALAFDFHTWAARRITDRREGAYR